MTDPDFISQRHWRTSDAHAERVVRLPDGRRIRATVRRNFYPHQSHARTDLWTDNGWVLVLTRDIREVPAFEVSSSHAGPRDTDLLDATLDLLIAAAQPILDPKDPA